MHRSVIEVYGDYSGKVVMPAAKGSNRYMRTPPAGPPNRRSRCVQMIIENRKPSQGDRKDLAQFFEPILEPGFAIGEPLFTEQKCLSHATGNTVVPACDGGIDQSLPGSCHWEHPY
jgi:hypothetical protein